MSTIRILIATLASIVILVGCAKTADSDAPSSGGGGGSTAPVLASNYKTTCTSLGGTFFGATYTDSLIVFSTDSYTNQQSFYSNASCSSEVFRFVVGGDYSIGSAAAAPANAYNITFTPTSTSVVSNAGSTGTALNAGCSPSPGLSTTTLDSKATSTLGMTCGGMGYVARNIPTYNIFVLGATLSFGAVFRNNLGQQTQGGVATTTSISYIPF